MKPVYVAAAVVVVALLLAGLVWAAWLNSEQTSNQQGSEGVVEYTYSIVATFPHDTSAYTEGLVFANGSLYESTGNYGSSSLRQVSLENGSVLQQVMLPSEYFGEGLTAVNDLLVQLTWRNGVGFVYERATLGLLGNFSYATDGWGLTFDGSRLIMSDGSSKLYFLDPTTFQRTGEVSVHSGNSSVMSINELEYVNGAIYANVWPTQRIALINPQTGAVKGWIDMSGLYEANNPSNNPDKVLNGIAYDTQAGRLFVTGKDWANLYQIQITPKT